MEFAQKLTEFLHINNTQNTQYNLKKAFRIKAHYESNLRSMIPLSFIRFYESTSANLKYFMWISCLDCGHTTHAPSSSFLTLFSLSLLILINSLWLFEFCVCYEWLPDVYYKTVRATHFYMLYTPHRYIYWVCGFCGLEWW